MRSSPVPILVLLIQLACGTSPEEQPVACTMIGCEDQLAIELLPPPSGAYRVEVVGAANAETRSVECPSDVVCMDDGGRTVRFPGFTPEQATVRVIAGGDTIVRELRPTYRPVYPNGPQCGVGCRQAVDTVELHSNQR